MQDYLCLCVVVSAKLQDSYIKVLFLKNDFEKWIILFFKKILLLAKNIYYRKASKKVCIKFSLCQLISLFG